MDWVDVALVVDMSGSMGMIRDETIRGFNRYIKSLKSETRGNVSITTVLFNGNQVTKSRYSDVKNVPDLDCRSYVPDGTTPLYDAIRSAINTLDVSDGKKKILVILTDGYENSSKETTQSWVQDAIKNRQNSGWVVVYLGAGKDSWGQGMTISVSAQDTIEFNKDDIGVAFATLACSTVNFVNSTDDNEKTSKLPFFHKIDGLTVD